MKEDGCIASSATRRSAPYATPYSFLSPNRTEFTMSKSSTNKSWKKKSSNNRSSIRSLPNTQLFFAWMLQLPTKSSSRPQKDQKKWWAYGAWTHKIIRCHSSMRNRDTIKMISQIAISMSAAWLLGSHLRKSWKELSSSKSNPNSPKRWNSERRSLEDQVNIWPLPE